MAGEMVSVRVIGLGNAFRGDDAIGLEVARFIGHQTCAVDVIVSVSDGTALLDLWEGVPLCIVIDCAVSGQRPGTIHVFDGLTEPIPQHLFSSFSTHVFSLSRAIELGRTLGRLPHGLHVYGIEGGCFSGDAQITEPVRRAGEQVARQVLTVIRNHRRKRAHEPARR